MRSQVPSSLLWGLVECYFFLCILITINFHLFLYAIPFEMENKAVWLIDSHRTRYVFRFLDTHSPSYSLLCNLKCSYGLK